MDERDRVGDAPRQGSPLEVLGVFGRLGFTSFGGPVAHLGYFRDEFVVRRRWVSAETYADTVALCQFLPGPASSQVAIAVGVMRAGVAGGVAAWLGFTLPSALLLVAFALGLGGVGDVADAAWLRGLTIVAVAVVAHAVWGMAQTSTPDRGRVTLALAAAVATLVWPSSVTHVLVIAAGATIGWRLLTAPVATGAPAATEAAPPAPARAASRRGAFLLVVFAALLLALPAAREESPATGLAVADAFYRSGSLVFGGGHVVLPLLRAEVVEPGWVSAATFTAGYGAAQAVPGPLFTFAAFLGAAVQPGADGVLLGALALVAVFAPSFLLVLGVWPFWSRLRLRRDVRAALRGVNAAVVGILLAALYDPVFTTAVSSPVDMALALAAFGALAFWRWPSWAVVLATAAAAAAAGALGAM